MKSDIDVCANCKIICHIQKKIIKVMRIVEENIGNFQFENDCS